MSLFDHRNFLFPFGGGGGGASGPAVPLKAYMRSWLIGTNDDGSINDRLTIVTPEPVVVNVDCLDFPKDSSVNKIELLEVFNPKHGTRWAITFTVPDNYSTKVAGVFDIIVGGAGGKSVLMDENRIAFFVGGAEYHIWAGVVPSDYVSATYLLYCNDADGYIYLSIDGVYKGGVKPSNTELYATSYADAWGSKLSDVGGWHVPASHVVGTPLQISDAYFYHAMQEGFGQWLGDSSGHNRYGKIVTPHVNKLRGKSDSIRSINLEFGTNYDAVTSTDLIINSDFRYGAFAWLGTGGSHIIEGEAILQKNGTPLSYIIQGLAGEFVTNARYRLEYTIGAGSSGLATFAGVTNIAGGGAVTLDLSEGKHVVDVIADGSYEGQLILSADTIGTFVHVTKLDLRILGLANSYIPSFTEPMKSIRYEEILTTERMQGADWTTSAGSTVIDGTITLDVAGYAFLPMPYGYLQNTKVYFLYMKYESTNHAGDLVIADQGFGGTSVLLGTDSGGVATGHAIVCADITAPLVLASSGWAGVITEMSLICVDDIFVASPTGSMTDIFGRELQMPAKKLHNGCGVSLVQSTDAWQLLDTILSEADGSYANFDLIGVHNGKPQFLYITPRYPIGDDIYIYIQWDISVSLWEMYVPTGDPTQHFYHPTANGAYPPKTGWPVPLVLLYKSHWIDDDGNLIRRDFDNFLSTPNLTKNELLRWGKTTEGNCFLEKVIEYNAKTTDELTEEEYDSMVSFSGEDCGVGAKVILRDSSSEIIRDVDGEIIFTMPA